MLDSHHNRGNRKVFFSALSAEGKEIQLLRHSFPLGQFIIMTFAVDSLLREQLIEQSFSISTTCRAYCLLFLWIEICLYGDRFETPVANRRYFSFLRHCRLLFKDLSDSYCTMLLKQQIPDEGDSYWQLIQTLSLTDTLGLLITIGSTAGKKSKSAIF
jgi:hypothetical protein